MTDSNNPSMSTQLNSTPISHELNVTNQYAAHKQEELSHVAPKILPLTMENAVLNLTGKIFIDLLELRKVINAADANIKLNSSSVNTLYSLIDNINETLLIKIPQELDKLTL